MIQKTRNFFDVGKLLSRPNFGERTVSVARLFFHLIVLTLWVTGCCRLQRPLARQTSENIVPFLSQVPPPFDSYRQAKFYTDFLTHYYAPWQMHALDVTFAKATWAVRYYTSKTIYAENRLPFKKESLKKWINNSNNNAFNTLKCHAIVTHPSSLRLFPTIHPMFYNPNLAGEGFPFDYNQNSAIKAFTPLIVSHLSRDGGWAFVQSPFALGWIKMRDMAFINEGQIRQLMQLAKTVLLEEHASIYNKKRAFLFYAKMATLFPKTGEEPEFYKVLVPENLGGNLTFQDVLLPVAWIQPMPLAMNEENIGRVTSELLGESYGWGGLVEARDCSAMTRDFFAPFGLWLPRNSKAQAAVGKIVNLSGYDPSEKEKMILEKGVPFRTLLYLPGHIMLYIGRKEGRAYVMHNLWGIRTRENGRIIIGRTVITDLYLGETLPDVACGSLLINRITSMNIVTQW